MSCEECGALEQEHEVCVLDCGEPLCPDSAGRCDECDGAFHEDEPGKVKVDVYGRTGREYCSVSCFKKAILRGLSWLPA